MICYDFTTGPWFHFLNWCQLLDLRGSPVYSCFWWQMERHNVVNHLRLRSERASCGILCDHLSMRRMGCLGCLGCLGCWRHIMNHVCHERLDLHHSSSFLRCWTSLCLPFRTQWFHIVSYVAPWFAPALQHCHCSIFQGQGQLAGAAEKILRGRHNVSRFRPISSKIREGCIINVHLFNYSLWDVLAQKGTQSTYNQLQAASWTGTKRLCIVWSLLRYHWWVIFWGWKPFLSR